MEIKNGSTVHLIWKTLPDADLRAVFQYPHDAETYCRTAVADLMDGTFLVAVNHYDGSMKCFHKPSKAAE